MGIESFNRTLAYINDMLQVGIDLTKKKNGTLDERFKIAGANLFGNAMATMTADSIYKHTGSSAGYLAKYAAGSDNPKAALQNTIQAGMITEMIYHNPWGAYYGCGGGMYDYGMYGGMYSGMYGGGMCGCDMFGGLNASYSLNLGKLDPRFSTFYNNSFFRTC